MIISKISTKTESDIILYIKDNQLYLFLGEIRIEIVQQIR